MAEVLTDEQGNKINEVMNHKSLGIEPKKANNSVRPPVKTDA
jgi:hypothetical protein